MKQEYRKYCRANVLVNKMVEVQPNKKLNLTLMKSRIKVKKD